MSLSPYLSPTNLNGMLSSGNLISGALYPDGYDKRKSDLFNGADVSLQSVVRTTTEIIDTVADVTESVANLAGKRSNLYIIGQVPEEDENQSGWVDSSTKGLVRAISSAKNLFAGTKYKQQGVIIDGLGDIDATIGVDFSTNPMVYLSENIVDNRVRVPTVVKMTVLVSDYNNDDWKGTLVSALDNLDPLGISSQFLQSSGRTRSQDKLYQLRGLMETGVPFTLYTPHGIYENMLIKTLRPRTDAEKMDMLYCDVEFREVIMYTEYSTNPGRIPARRDVSYVASGWTQTAVKKAKEV